MTADTAAWLDAWTARPAATDQTIRRETSAPHRETTEQDHNETGENDLQTEIHRETTDGAPENETTETTHGQVGDTGPHRVPASAKGLRRRKRQPSDDKRIYRPKPRFTAAEIDRVRSLAGSRSLEGYIAIRALTDPRDDAEIGRDAIHADRVAERTMLRRALVDAYDECKQEKRDLVGIATNLNQATMRANSTQAIGWIVELLPGIQLLRDELAARAQRIDELIDRLDRALP